MRWVFTDTTNYGTWHGALAVKFVNPCVSSHFPEERSSRGNLAMYPRKDRRCQICWLLPRENTAEAGQGSGGVIISLTWLDRVLARSQQNYQILLNALRCFETSWGCCPLRPSRKGKRVNGWTNSCLVNSTSNSPNLYTATRSFCFRTRNRHKVSSWQTFTHFTLHYYRIDAWAIRRLWLAFVNALANSTLGRFYTARNSKICFVRLAYAGIAKAGE